MIDLSENPDLPPYKVFSALSRHEKVLTEREAPAEVPEGIVVDDGRVCLTKGDEMCPDCDEKPLIDPSGFGKSSQFYQLLTSQLLKYGKTRCEPHLAEAQQ